MNAQQIFDTQKQKMKDRETIEQQISYLGDSLVFMTLGSRIVARINGSTFEEGMRFTLQTYAYEIPPAEALRFADWIQTMFKEEGK